MSRHPRKRIVSTEKTGIRAAYRVRREENAVFNDMRAAKKAFATASEKKSFLGLLADLPRMIFSRDNPPESERKAGVVYGITSLDQLVAAFEAEKKAGRLHPAGAQDVTDDTTPPRDRQSRRSILPK